MGVKSHLSIVVIFVPSSCDDSTMSTSYRKKSVKRRVEQRTGGCSSRILRKSVKKLATNVGFLT